MQKIDIRKTSALKKRMRMQMWMSKKRETSADIRPISNLNIL